MTILHLGLVLFIIVAGFIKAVPSNAANFLPFGIKGAFNGASVVFFSYIGFDCIATAAGEAARGGGVAGQQGGGSAQPWTDPAARLDIAREHRGRALVHTPSSLTRAPGPAPPLRSVTLQRRHATRSATSPSASSALSPS